MCKPNTLKRQINKLKQTEQIMGLIGMALDRRTVEENRKEREGSGGESEGGRQREIDTGREQGWIEGEREG